MTTIACHDIVASSWNVKPQKLAPIPRAMRPADSEQKRDAGILCMLDRSNLMEPEASG
jgi:hypothetical protein